jgi:hypothetical protein
MNTEKEKKDNQPTAVKTGKNFSKTEVPERNYDSTEQKKPKVEPLAPRTPEVSKNIPVEKTHKN